MNKPSKFIPRPETISCNNGFWDRPVEERNAAYDKATNNGELGSFWDLSPEERSRAYDQD